MFCDILPLLRRLKLQSNDFSGTIRSVLDLQLCVGSHEFHHLDDSNRKKDAIQSNAVRTYGQKRSGRSRNPRKSRGI